MVNDANVVTADVDASNGVIHVIDAVLIPPDIDAAALIASDMDSDMDEAADQLGTIVDVAVEAGSFETLVAAVTAAELAETLSGEGPFTVFAPTDEAFAALPEALVPCLLEDENQEALASILTYHVVEGAVFSTDLVEGEVATVQGEEITIGLTDGVTINETVSVVTADIEADNGVIHVIDGVIVPPSIDVEEFLATC
jgi:uncharacterized surface protein with fasciclin (FAS1) repeats